MICKKCGTKNNDSAKFCKNCGSQLQHDQSAYALQKENKEAGKKNTGKKWGIFFILVIIVAGIIAGLWISKPKEEKQINEYNNQITQGNKYVEDLDYEKAEASYLKAIKIDPKRKDPYLKLADVYVAQEQYDKAVKILEEASENVAVTEEKGKKNNDISKIKKEIEEKKEEISNASEYTWVLQPEIEADDIYYLRASDNRENATNELQKQKESKYAVLKQKDRYSLIEMDGKIIDLDKAVNTFARQSNSDSNKKFVVDSVKTLDGYYRLSVDGGDSCIITDEGKVENCPDYEKIELQGSYYFYNGLENTLSGMKYSDDQEYTEKLKELSTTIPLKKADRLYNESSNGDPGIWSENLSSKYALWKDGNLIGSYIYDECGSENSGLMAVQKDGKWGYIDKLGKEVIPIEYDASWNEYYADLGQTIQKDYCYAATEGYITLFKNKKWEMRTTDNKLVILPGVFEKILPVYDGKCWVKKNGKWGVIQLSEAEPENNITDAVEDTTEKSENTENDGIFTREQIAYIKQQLGVPDSDNIAMTISDNPYYWETGECTLVNVTFTENGEFVAGADVNVDTAECTTSLFNYTKN